jgi:hypothetical protein
MKGVGLMKDRNVTLPKYRWRTCMKGLNGWSVRKHSWYECEEA